MNIKKRENILSNCEEEKDGHNNNCGFCKHFLHKVAKTFLGCCNYIW